MMMSSRPSTAAGRDDSNTEESERSKDIERRPKLSWRNIKKSASRELYAVQNRANVVANLPSLPPHRVFCFFSLPCVCCWSFPKNAEELLNFVFWP